MGRIWEGTYIDCLQRTPRARVHELSLHNSCAVPGACLHSAPDLAHSQDAHAGHTIVQRRQDNIECRATLDGDRSGFGGIRLLQSVEFHEVLVQRQDGGSAELGTGEVIASPTRGRPA
jgi:hypothetical protein